MSSIAASPTKLKSGDWGAKVHGDVKKGDVVTITTRSGKSWTARVMKVVWSGKGVAICATESLDRPVSSRSRGRMGPGHGSAAPVRGYSSYCTDRPDCGCYDCAS